MNTNQKNKIELPRLKCRNCGGAKWFPSAIGNVACTECNGTGKGGIDVHKLHLEWERLHERIAYLERQLEDARQRDNVTAAIAFGKGM